MVDIMDMEDIFEELVYKTIKDIWLNAEASGKTEMQNISMDLVKKITAEVADFVDDQKNIACNNCKGKKFKYMKSACEAM